MRPTRGRQRMVADGESPPRFAGRVSVNPTAEVTVGSLLHEMVRNEDDARFMADAINGTGDDGVWGSGSSGMVTAYPFTEADRAESDVWPWSICVDVVEPADG